MGGNSSSSTGNPDMIRDFDGSQFVSNPTDNFSDTLDKVHMNRVLAGDEPSNPFHYVMDHFRESSAFHRVAEQGKHNK